MHYRCVLFCPCSSLLEHCGPCGHRCLALSSGSHPRGKDCRPVASISTSAGTVQKTTCQQLAKRQRQFPTTTSRTNMVGATIRLRAPRQRLLLLWVTRVDIGQTFFWTDLLQAKPCSLQAWNRHLKKERRDYTQADIRSCTLWHGVLHHRRWRRHVSSHTQPLPGASSSSR